MRALMNFMHRDGWWFHILAADAKTVLLGYTKAASQEALLGIVAKLGGSVEDAELDIRRWRRGSVWIDPSPAQCKALGIRKPVQSAPYGRERQGWRARAALSLVLAGLLRFA